MAKSPKLGAFRRPIPGFIDVHSRGDKEAIEHLPNKIQQGVTTEIVGNCGYSLFPTRPAGEGAVDTGEL
jgi:N-acyl-D-aspartate/D-glutamate deacylase